MEVRNNPGIKSPNVRLRHDVYHELNFFVKILAENDNSIPYQGASIQEVVNDFIKRGLEEYKVSERREKFKELRF
jgi:hypothetical protein